MRITSTASWPESACPTDVHGNCCPGFLKDSSVPSRGARSVGLSPRDVDLIEATPRGIPAWRRRRGREPQIALGSGRLERPSMRDRIRQGEYRPCAHGGRCGQLAQGPAGPEASRLAPDGEFRAAGREPGIGGQSVPCLDPAGALASPSAGQPSASRRQRLRLRRNQRPCPDRGMVRDRRGWLAPAVKRKWASLTVDPRARGHRPPGE